MSKKRDIFWSFLAKGFCNLKNELFKSEIKLIVKGGVSMWLPFLYLGLGILIGFCKMKWPPTGGFLFGDFRVAFYCIYAY